MAYSLCILKAMESRDKKLSRYFNFYSLYNTWKDQLHRINGSQFYEWPFGLEKSSGLWRNGPRMSSLSRKPHEKVRFKAKPKRKKKSTITQKQSAFFVLQKPVNVLRSSTAKFRRKTPLYGKPLKTFYQVRQTCLNSERYLLHVTSTTRHTGAHQYEVPFRLEVQCQNALQKLAFFPKLLLCCPLKDTDLWERKLWQLQNHGPIMI